MSLLMPKQVIFACKPARNVRTPVVIAEECMLAGSVDLLVSPQVFRCDKASATDSAGMGARPMPAGMMALRCQQAVFVQDWRSDRQATHSLSAFELNDLPHSSQDIDVDDPA